MVSMKPLKRINLYIETILGCGSELHRTQDHGTGRHGSPPSCAQSADEWPETTLAIMSPATHKPHRIRDDSEASKFRRE